MSNPTPSPKPTDPPQPEGGSGLHAPSCHALFSGHCYYPDGGAEDFRAWGTIEELKELYAKNADKWSMDAAGSYADPWGQIAERETMSVILTIRGHGDWVNCSAGDDCIQCDNSGTVVISTDADGYIDEIGPCEWCHREPNSKFNKQNAKVCQPDKKP